MDKNRIIESIEQTVIDRGCFIVEVTVSKDDDIVLAIEKEVGDVCLEDCEAVNDAFVELFDRDVEDYSLTVTSAGLDQPFKVLKQFVKAIGSSVDVKLKNGKKLTGVLTAADEGSITLRYSAKEIVEGKKRKVLVDHEDKFASEDFNSVTPHIVFKK